MSLSSDQIRRAFIDYFVARGHEHVSSGSLVPVDDPSLLFTNAGMNQFKSVFLGETQREYSRAVTVQKCMRVSGKHNDLETVGPSLYHHTLFEMLGNFSFGDYFKAEAIRLAWGLFIDGYGLDKERLWATVYEEDDEAEELWQTETDLLPGRVVRLGKEDNYWSMGETGPCGPCSELHYDYEWDGTAIEEPDFDAGRFVELWNLVFMQFNASADGGVAPLPNPSIDTGAGLERLAAVLQGKRSNYDTDLFLPLIASAASAVSRDYGVHREDDIALRVIADHSRATAFLLADGVMPSNEGRGYVLRRLLRRAGRFGMKLGFDGPFLYRSCLDVIELMHGAYPELGERRELIERVARSEEARFLQTLAAGSQRFNELAEQVRAAGATELPGAEVFKLYDTYGLPIELTREFAAAENLAVDESGFQTAMEAQRARARAAWKGAADEPVRELVRQLVVEHGPTVFRAYSDQRVEGARVVAILRDGALVSQLETGESGALLLDATPFYAESGGQIGDRGRVTWPGGAAAVSDATRPVAGAVVHEIRVEEGTLAVGKRVDLQIDDDRRSRTRANHTATHLLHAALREQLGEHVRQAGSLVEPERLRFDFSHDGGLAAAELDRLEMAINQWIRANIALDIAEMNYDEAIERGALAFFGEKYGDRVRVVSVPGVSMELCGGTHVVRTGDIGPFFIQREESVAAGTRRIEALTGGAALTAMRRYRDVVRSAAAKLKAPEDGLVEGVERLVERAHEAERDLEQLRVSLAADRAAAAIEQGTVEVAGVRVVRQTVAGLDAAAMRTLADDLKHRLGSGVVVLGAERDGKASLVVGVTDDLVGRIGAGQIVGKLAKVVGGGGGGKREIAQAGGPDATKVGLALEKAPELIAKLLQ